MNRIDAAFDNTKRSNEIALICFVTAGDPDFDTTRQVVTAIARSGADIVELGIPFSDPLADGPSIQASSFRALKAGATVQGVLDCVSQIRRDCDIPIVLMTYYNPVHKWGAAAFAKDASAAGADGVILTDLPFEEQAEWKRAADSSGLATIQLIAPTSTKDRIALGAKMGSGFIYCVSRTGVTGARSQVTSDLVNLVDDIRSATDLPVAVGFGISKPEHVSNIAAFADGAVVGSAVVDLMAEHAGKPEMLGKLSEYIRSLKSAARKQG